MLDPKFQRISLAAAGLVEDTHIRPEPPRDFNRAVRGVAVHNEYLIHPTRNLWQDVRKVICLVEGADEGGDLRPMAACHPGLEMDEAMASGSHRKFHNPQKRTSAITRCWGTAFPLTSAIGQRDAILARREEVKSESLKLREAANLGTF
jgi:hypothetical protein